MNLANTQSIDQKSDPVGFCLKLGKLFSQIARCRFMRGEASGCRGFFHGDVDTGILVRLDDLGKVTNNDNFGCIALDAAKQARIPVALARLEAFKLVRVNQFHGILRSGHCWPLPAWLSGSGGQGDHHASGDLVAVSVLGPVRSRTYSGQGWVGAAYCVLPAVAQYVDVDGAFSAVADAQVFFIVHRVRAEARRLGFGDDHGVRQQAEDHVRWCGVGHQHRLAQGARQAAVDHDTGFFVDLVGDRFVDDVEVSAGGHDPQGDTAELVTELAHAASQRLLAVGFDVGRNHHAGVRANRGAQTGNGVLDEAFQGRVGYVSADDLGELIHRSTATLERLFGGLVRAVLPWSLDAKGSTGTDFLRSHLAGGVDVAVFQRAADLVEGALAEVTFDQFVVEDDCAVGRCVEHIQIVLDALH